MHEPDSLQAIALDLIEDKQLLERTFYSIGAQAAKLWVAKCLILPRSGRSESFRSESSRADWNRQATSALALSTYHANWISKSAMKKEARWIARLIDVRSA